MRSVPSSFFLKKSMQDKDSSLIKEKKMFDRIQQESLDFGPRLLFVKRFVYSSVSLISSTMSSFYMGQFRLSIFS